uniref:NADH-ubiquinone oxidoreductase chain 5 n=1 Tax=Gonioctena intermedia TaxID=63691 RepID=A0A1L5IYV6_GONIN|nr:NADH dehydrogenase subunit 5 [Gonioctena intermedia]APM86023.1 NADH dehydrogenase subunit 5 [Gonioctena intermedia]AVX29548.1 NADH dehydrogenase subunit 5 [Gonioctena intermedia]AVX29561.1 NADH dehydrogenase subunit 5 [Gonioctena intermedia]
MFFSLLLFMSCISFSSSLMFLSWDYSLILEFNLVSLNSSNFVMVILLDWMSLLFMSFVFFISSMVIFYSEEYMLGDLFINRFIMLVFMFVLSMMFLIISPNLISILLGWDGLGLVSYCLVIYYQNVKSYNAGMLTALSNRIGDVALLMAIAWMLNFGSWNFIFYLEMMKGDLIMELINYLVVLAAMTKSAQIPFSSWLPAAMAAPTPVSSLVHSSTLVTAGVYLLIRFNYSFSENLMYLLLFISSMTMFMSGLGANFEYDLKKIIALSTLSQLGLMMSILALGSYKLAFFHLLTHALFKALLFMCAGNIIHNLNNCQDIRFMGGLIKHMPLTCTFFNICNFSLCGLPFLSGFYSKDLIVEVLSMNYLNMYIYMIFYISIGLTVCYSFRLTYYSLTGTFNFLSLNSLTEQSYLMLKSMGGLIFFVIFSGSMLMWLIFPSPVFICLPMVMKLMTLFMIMIGIWLGYEMAKFKIFYKLKSNKYLNLVSFFALMWNMPMLSTLGINFYPLFLSKVYINVFDQGWLEYYGGLNISNTLKKVLVIQFLSLNHLKVYFLMFIIWLVFLMINIL